MPEKAIYLQMGEESKNVNFKVPRRLVAQVEIAARLLETDLSAFARLAMKEKVQRVFKEHGIKEDPFKAHAAMLPNVES